MTEIELKISGIGSLEYTAESVPRKGEYISVDLEGINDTFAVRNVVYRLFESRGKKLTYVTVYAEADR